MSTILVVDDNATNRKLVATLLTFEGHEILEAGNGVEGLAIARLKRPQLIISDILMPEMDGYEFVRRLRTDSDLKGTAVIFYTANYHQCEAQALAAKCHVEQVIVKPCAPRDFIAAVAAILGSKPAPPRPPDIQFDREHLQLLTNKLAQTSSDLQRSNDRLAALIELNVQLSSQREAQPLLDQVCAGARNLFASRFAVLSAAARLDARAAYTACSGLELPAGAPPPRAESGLLGSMLREPRSIRLAVPMGMPSDTGLPDVYAHATSFVAAPIASPARTYGWICLADKLGSGEFTAEDESLLTMLGALVGRIYENGALYAEVQNRAAELFVEISERELAIKELLESEARFRQLAENIEDVFCLLDPRSQRLLYVSPAYERIWGRSCQELLDDPTSWALALHPDDDWARQMWQRLLDDLPIAGTMEFRIVRPDLSVRWIQSRVFGICDASGAVIRAAGVASDVTERNAAEEKVRRMNRVYAMLSGINSLIVRADDRALLLDEACRLAVTLGSFGAAWCGLLDNTGHIRSASASGRIPDYLSQSSAAFDDPADMASPVANAISTGEPVISDQLRGRADGFSKSLYTHGYMSAVTLPLISAGRPVGCIVLASAEPDFFDAAEMRLLAEFAGDIAFALDYINKAEQLNYLAYYDVLTGFPNRTLFLDRLAQRLNPTGATPPPQLAVIVVDPERFATFNNTLGRSASDQLLRAIALRFADSVGSPDVVGRIGSDQFAAAITITGGLADTPKLLEELWRSWLGAGFGSAEHPVRISAKAGIALFPGDGDDAESLLRNAETALRTAKTSSRPYAAYTSKLSEELLARLAIEKNLRKAIDREEFVLHYQPKVDLKTRDVLGLEALIRWDSPELGMLPPAKFITILEETGLIVEVGAWALRQARGDRSRWQEKRLNAPRIAVNVSTVQVRADDFVRTMTNVARLGGLDPGLDVEVTESLLIDDAADNLAKLNAIRELGFRISLDDFGTGYSSLSYLAKLPVNQLKIDRTFVSTMLDDPSAMTLVSTIISLARALRLETVAEGVELEDQAKILRLLQCDQMQGYLICKPIAFDEMTTYLSRRRSLVP